MEKLTIGSVDSMDASGTIQFADGMKVAGKEVVALRRLDRAVPLCPRQAHLVLNNGDRLVGSPFGMEGAMLLVRPSVLMATNDHVKIPLTAIASLWLRPPDLLERERLAPLLATERDRDRVLLKNGDLLAGTLVDIDTEQRVFQFDLGGERRSVAIPSTAAIAFSTKLARARKPEARYYHLVLTNGTRLTLISATIADGELTGQTIYKNMVRVQLGEVCALDVRLGPAVYLSDLKPKHYDYRTFQGEMHGWSADRSLDGKELQLPSPAGTMVFDKGLALHGESTLLFALDGKFTRFESSLGLDPILGRRGSALVSVIVDGKEIRLNEGKPLTMASGTIPVQLDVKAMKELMLVVRWGDGGNVGDCVNWGDARLIP